MFGGVSAEHEVSIISGLQVIEKIDRNEFAVHALYVTEKGEFRYFDKLNSRKSFSRDGGVVPSFTRSENGAYLSYRSGLSIKKINIDVAYLAFHGGNGENGDMQGFLESLSVPYTSASVESMAITMNKSLCKEVLHAHALPVVEGITFSSNEIRQEVSLVVQQVEEKLGKISEKNGVIIKPSHSGSSIGINIAKDSKSLKRFLKAAALIDREVLVEKLLQDFTEYNCAVRFVRGEIEASEIEKPLSQDEILSFADKYERGGGKKSGANSSNSDGMASLSRELPANISQELKLEIQELARQAFQACRAKGMVRIDFMVTKSGEKFITEINSIPGSMAYYLWEASGHTFTEQITQLIEQAISDHQKLVGYRLSHESDIVEKFIAAE